MSDIAKYIDHTLLKATATWEEIASLCDVAVREGAASVCVPPSFVKKIRENYPTLTICTVVGFPLGNTTTKAKAEETKEALENGADEIDMVIHIGRLKEKDTDYVTEEIRTLKEICGQKILKVIVETCYLDEEEKRLALSCVEKAGADFIKTSTGFGTKGAELEDVKRWAAERKGNTKIKAAGGIKTEEQALEFIKAGADRIGASSILK